MEHVALFNDNVYSGTLHNCLNYISLTKAETEPKLQDKI